MTRQRLTANRRVKIFEANEGICHLCEQKIQVGQPWDVSHMIPLELGGPDTEANMLVAHRSCHRAHTAAVDAPAIAKAKRIRAKHLGAQTPTRRPFPGSRASKFRRRMNGTVERRDL